MDAMQTLAGNRVVPVVVIEDEGNAVELATTLVEAGIKAIEVTLRSEAALASIEAIAKQVPEIMVGAGSVRRSEQFDAIAACGAAFAVSPGASPALIDRAQALKMPFVPGAASASESIFLMEHGYHLQKFFPAELGGGLNMIKALSAPLPEVRFFPTGGITATLAVDYLQLPCVHCVGGTWIASSELINNAAYEQIGTLARAAATL